MSAIENLVELQVAEKRLEVGYLPPHSLEAEQSVLGGLLLDNAMWDEVVDRLAPAMFYQQAHRLVFQAIQALAERDQPMDVVTVSEALEEARHLAGNRWWARSGRCPAENRNLAAELQSSQTPFFLGLANARGIRCKSLSSGDLQRNTVRNLYR